MERDKQTARLGRALLVYVLLAILLITWAPFRFSVPARVELTWDFTPTDLLLNVCLFIPVGFLFYASLRRRRSAAGRRRHGRSAVLFGVLFSLLIEAGQILVPERYTSLWDVLTNGLGAYLGALLYLRVSTGLSRFLPGHPTLELPLMNLVYLSTIALWLNGLAAVETPWRTALIPPLSVVGVNVLAAVWRYRLAAALTRHQVILGTTGWFVVATAPSLLSLPFLVVAAIVSVSGLMWYLTGRRSDLGGDERRFELPTLKRAAIPFGLYVVLLALWPLPASFGALEVSFPLSLTTPEPSIPQIFGFLEHLVAFTILGFMIAEWRGRRKERAATAIVWVILGSTLASLGFQLVKGVHIGLHASIAEGLATTLAAMAGAALYRRQLAALRSWLSREEASSDEMALEDLLDRFDEG